MSEEYARIEAEKALSASQNISEKIIYDCVDYPPP